MRLKRVLLPCLVLILGIGCTSKKDGKNHTGDSSSKAPGFTVRTLDGQVFKSDQLKGKLTVLDFWATWCGPCIQEVPHYNALYSKYGPEDFAMVGITLDSGTAGQIEPYVSRFGIEYPIYVGDEEIKHAFGGIWGYPTTIVIDKNWNIVARFTGISSDRVTKIVDDLMEGS